ncbi:class I SAM-dependent methyltransferase [Extibacter muris]|uniref:class I SAM-dependent methyltransferase n=1 Tax=Extibacter muris TaxID=1796622 RepID=UPI001D06864E|nr:class I SAM-dependent methyltransferase [Extibacter muris]MCB6203830.1 class I SAM-dependent methyltransferase [Extibacter muris]MCQ4665529.1 class I SAM-dependent methyltransferase [Extibacter muris]MCQ4694909.1 class I SAM-dependent methyltransferase [Extibacter muris]
MKRTSIDYYEKYAETFFETTVLADMQMVYQPFLSLVKPQGRILDLGCGSGRDSRYFIRHGYQVEAVDGSPALARLASEYIGQEVICGRIEELEYDQEFDGIWACASLVHIEKKDMPEILKKLKRALNLEGILYISLKYGEGEGVKDGRFFSYYDEVQLRKVFNRLKYLKIIKLFRTEDVRQERKQELWINVLARAV